MPVIYNRKALQTPYKLCLHLEAEKSGVLRPRVDFKFILKFFISWLFCGHNVEIMMDWIYIALFKAPKALYNSISGT